MNRVKLGEMAEFSTGPFGSQLHKSDYVAKGIPVLMPQDIDTNRSFTVGVQIDSADYQRLSRHALKGDDIVFARRGEVDKHAFIRERDLPALCGTGCLRVRVDAKKANPEYVSYCLNRPEAKAHLRSNAVGSNMPNLNTDILAGVEVLLPDRREQDAVVSLLSAIDAKIETNNKTIAELDSLARAVYDYWFVRRDVPADWEHVKVIDLVEIDRGVSYSAPDLADEGLPMLNLASFNTDASIKLAGTKHLSCNVQASKLLATADLVMCVTQQTAIDPTGELDVIAKTFLVPEVFETAPTFSMDVVRLKERRVGARFLVNQMMRRADYHRFAGGYANGTKIKHLDVEGALSFSVALPPNGDPFISRYADLSLAWHKEQSALLGESMRLASIRDYLLPMLMNGQVTIDSEAQNA